MTTADIRQADLWLCWDCCIPHLNVGVPRECSRCGTELEYLGEIDYHNKQLGKGNNGDR